MPQAEIAATTVVDRSADGRFGVAVVQSLPSASLLRFYDNDAAGSLSEAGEAVSSSLQPGAMVSGNFSGGSRKDVLLGGANGLIDGYFANGRGFDGPVRLADVSGAIVNMAVADFNRDGRADLLAATAARRLHVFFGNGAGQLTEAAYSPIALPGEPGAMAVADFDAEGSPGVAVAGAHDQVWVFRASGGAISAAPTETLAAASPRAIAAGDFDADGYPDLAIAAARGIQIFLRLPAGGFAPAGTLRRRGIPQSVAVADLDGDGWLDIIAPNAAGNRIERWAGARGGRFRGPESIAALPAPREARIAGVSRDGRVDLLVLSDLGFHAMRGSCAPGGRATGIASAAPAAEASPLTGTPASLSFAYTVGQPAPGNQPVAIQSTAGPLVFTASITSGASWLSIAGAATGTTPAILSVVVNPAGLAAGAYEGAIAISPTSGGAPLTIPVTLTVAGPLTVSPSAMDFTYTLGDPDPENQVLTIASSGGASTFSATALADAAGNWLTLTGPQSGTTPGSVTVHVAPRSLAPGLYGGAVTITSPALPGPIRIPVTLRIIGPFTVSPAALNFTYVPAGAVPPPQTIAVGSVEGSMPFTAAASGGTWLSVSPASGATPATLTVTVNPTGLPIGVYTGAITVAALNPADGVHTIAVSLTVTGSIAAAPAAVSLDAVMGSSILPVPVFISSSGTPIAYTAAPTSSGWLSLDRYTGSTPGSFAVLVNNAGLLPGYYLGSVTITAGSNPPLIIPVSLNLRGSLTVSPTALAFTAAAGGPPAATQSLAATAGSPMTPVSATASTADGRNWLSVAPAGPGLFAVAANAGGLVPGTYSGTIRFESPLAVNSPRLVSVSFTVTPALAVSARNLDFAVLFGGSTPEPRAVNVTAGGGAIAFSASATTVNGGPWLSVTPASGFTPAALTIHANPAGLPPGVYDGSVTVRQQSAPSNALIIPVRLSVTALLTAAPQTLEFLSFTGGPAPSVQTVTIGAGGAPVPFTATVSGGSWLQAVQLGPNSLRVSVSSAGLAAGTYTGSVVIASPLGSSPLPVPVTLTVAPPGDLQFSSEGFDFTTSTTQTTGVTSSNRFPLPFTISVDGGTSSARREASGVPWLSVFPPAGVTPVTIVATANPTGLAPGRYTAAIRFEALGRTYRLPVSLTVPDPAPRLAVSADPLELNASGNLRDTVQETLVVRNAAGAGTHPFTVTVVEGSWLTVTPASGVVTGEAPAPVTVSARIEDLPPGGYRGVVRVTLGGQTRDVPVRLFTGAGPSIALAFRGMQFEVRRGQGISLTRDVAILNSGAGVLNWSARVTRGANWLSISPSSGSSTRQRPGKITLRTNSRDLAVGAYYATIEIADPRASNSPQFMTVVLNVLDVTSSPTPVPSPAGLVFVAVVGRAAPPAQPVGVYTSSIEPITYNASATTDDGAKWLSVTPDTGTSATEATASVNVAVNHAGLPPGVYTGGVNFSMAPRVVRTANVTLIVTTVAPNPQPAPAAANRRFAAGCTPTRLAATHTGVVNSFYALAGWPMPVAVSVLDDCGEPVPDARVVLEFSNGDVPINMMLMDQQTATFTATWTPARPAQQTTITARATFGDLSNASQVTGIVPSGAAPVLAANGTLHNLNPRVGAPLAPGTVVMILGENLAPSVTTTGLPLPTEVNGTSVIIGGREAPLYYVSPTQINAQLPFELDPDRQYPILVLANGALTTPQNLNMTPAQPGVAAYPAGDVIAQHTADYSLVTPDSPARPGEVITVYLVGMGLTDVPVGTGAQAPGAEPFARVSNAASVTLGGQPSEILYSGLTPEGIGLYQINLRVPENANDGELPLSIIQNGSEANVARVPVRRAE
jgi:uncharacterized protein (TIGR03437 family)